MRTTVIIKGQIGSAYALKTELTSARAGNSFSRRLSIYSEEIKMGGYDIYFCVYFETKIDAYRALDISYLALKEDKCKRYRTKTKRTLEITYDAAKAYIKE